MFSLLPRTFCVLVTRTARHSLPKTRLFSASSSARTNKAIVYSRNGAPPDVLSVLTYPSLPPPASGTVNIRSLLSVVNPADLNTVEGVYPNKPSLISHLAESGKGSKDEPVYVGGNEGLAQVTSVGEDVDTLAVGDWVVMVKQQSGTWLTAQNVGAQDVIKIPDHQGLSEVHAATMTVNPPTAYNMLRDYVELKEGDWIMQNGANSGVGQAVIQIAAARGLKTLNFVRKNDDPEKLKERLRNMGATEVFTYEDLGDRSLGEKIKKLLDGKEIRLALNCVGGKTAAAMLKYISRDGHLVTYGAMSKQPLTLNTSAFIFKNLTVRGFWQSRWYLDHSIAERQELLMNLIELMKEGKLLEPAHEIISIDGQDDDSEATSRIRETFRKIAEGWPRKKVLIKFND